MSRIYLDNHATTPMLPEVWEVMQQCACDITGNASSAHQEGRRARRTLEDAREQIASLLDADAEEVIFTSGATEANNLALHGLTGIPPAHLLSSPLEHPCVVEPLKQLQESGFAVEHLPVDEEGRIAVDSLSSLLKPETRLLAVMLVNHETGAIQPVQQLRECAGSEVLFHCDAVQTVGKIPVRFHELSVTSLSLSGHKFHGPKGIGALLLQKGHQLQPMLKGGHQQQAKRPGTEPLPLIVGLAKALEIAIRDQEQRTQIVAEHRQRFLDVLHSQNIEFTVNGAKQTHKQSPYVANVSFPGLQGDALLMNFDLAGIACSTGSACSSGSLLPSPVLQAMGVSEDVLRSAIRFSFSPLLRSEEIETAAHQVAKVVARLHEMEPLQQGD